MSDTTKYINKSSTRNKTEFLCNQSGLNDGCKDVLIHISEAIDRMDTRMDRIEIKIAKGDPEMIKVIAVLQDRVNMHQHIFAAVGLALLGQMTAIIFALMK